MTVAMATKKKKRKIEKQNKQDARQLIMIAIGLTIFFMVLSYIFFMRS